MCTKRRNATFTSDQSKKQTYTFATQSLFPIVSYKEPAANGSCTCVRKTDANTDDLQMWLNCSKALSNLPPSPLSWLSPGGCKAADLPKPQRSRALKRINLKHQLETASRKLKEAEKPLTHHYSIQADVGVNTSVN